MLCFKNLFPTLGSKLRERESKRLRRFVNFFLALFVLFFCFLQIRSPALAASVSDTFTDTAGVLLNNHTSDTSNTWTRSVGTGNMAITNANRTRGNSGTSIYVSNWTPASADYEISADIYIASTPLISGMQFGVGGRAGAAAFTGYYALVMGTDSTIKLYRGGCQCQVRMSHF